MEDTHAEYRTTTTQQTYGPALHPEYVRTRSGILKIIEIVLSLITFICSIVDPWYGHGWVEFVSISAFITTGIYFVFHLLGLVGRFPGPWLLIEFIYYVVFSVFFFIAAIVAAVKAPSSFANVGATAFFAVACVVVYIIDSVFQFRTWRFGETRSTTTTTATSHATVEQGRAQY